jgi:hypothetical protein
VIVIGAGPPIGQTVIARVRGRADCGGGGEGRVLVVGVHPGQGDAPAGVAAAVPARSPGPRETVTGPVDAWVARCSNCTSVLMVVARIRGLDCVDLSGLAALEVDPPG